MAVAKELKHFHFRQTSDELTGFSVVRAVDGDDHEFLVAVPLKDDERRIRAIPPAWKPAVLVDQPVRILGFFVGLRDFGSQPDNDTVTSPGALQNPLNCPLFVARQIQWFPERISPELNIKPHEILLASKGVDINRLRQVGKRREPGIGREHAASFFQLLRATSQLGNALKPEPGIDLETMLRAPADCIGQPVEVSGHVRRVTEILLDDPASIQQLGAQSYYQIDMFVPLNNRRIVIKSPSEKQDSILGEQNLTIENRFPVTVCTSQNPGNTESIKRQRVSVKGIFFKNWSYESELSINSGSGARQIAPMIIAANASPAPPPSNDFHWIVASFGFLIFGGGLFLIWSYRSGTARNHRPPLPEQIDPPGIE